MPDQTPEPFTDDDLRVILDDASLARYSASSVRRFARQLIAAHARITELETVAIEVLAAAHRRIAELEKQQQRDAARIIQLEDEIQLLEGLTDE